jgi:hypothetical protein
VTTGEAVETPLRKINAAALVWIRRSRSIREPRGKLRFDRLAETVTRGSGSCISKIIK